MKVIRKIIDILAWICYAVILLFLFVAAPFVAGYKPVVVLSPSMEPTLPVGSVAYTKQAAFDQINVGDIITYQSPEDAAVWITHTVVVKNSMSMTFVTKGDANATNDPGELSYERVVGKALRYHVPFAGYYVQIMQTPYVIAALAVILIAKIILGFVGGEPKKPKEDKDDSDEEPEPSEEPELPEEEISEEEISEEEISEEEEPITEEADSSK